MLSTVTAAFRPRGGAGSLSLDSESLGYRDPTASLALSIPSKAGPTRLAAPSRRRPPARACIMISAAGARGHGFRRRQWLAALGPGPGPGPRPRPRPGGQTISLPSHQKKTTAHIKTSMLCYT